ncbi:MAG: cellulase family glycosylhydrolase [Bacteroidaceae bacterium]|nr:cellulase family glycosylhydrolase [Bacteroidaceae bacterium]
MRKLFFLLLVAVMMSSCSKTDNASPFVRQADGRLWLGDKEYRFVSTNMWYGALMASEGQGGDRARLCSELDTLHALGFDNLRVLVGAEGEEYISGQVWPTLQLAAGEYNDTLLVGLDYLLQQMQLRGMKAVLYMNNAWMWSGGYSYYLQLAGCGPSPIDMEDFDGYVAYAAQFSSNAKAKQMYLDNVRHIVTRTNSLTGVAYADDPTIMAWQLCNEPRLFCDTLKAEFAEWQSQATALIRSLDSNHLISTGGEGLVGCSFDAELLQQICSDPNVDYITVHIWPANWGWARRDALDEDLDSACILTTDYINQHLSLSRELHKPIVIEEFGYPRDSFSFSPSSTTTLRDRFYRHIVDAFHSNPEIAGLNFWAWGGVVTARHEMWQPFDPFMGDPPQEPQGLYSVFASDTSTIRALTK